MGSSVAAVLHPVPTRNTIGMRKTSRAAVTDTDTIVPRTLQPRVWPLWFEPHWVWMRRGRPTRQRAGNLCVAAGATSGCATFVVIMQTAKVRDLNDRAARGRVHRPRDRRILVQR